MATTKSRINISVPDEVREAISELARRDNMPDATKAGRLLEIGLEIEEDEVWDYIASKRDVPDAKFFTHDQAFKS